MSAAFGLDEMALHADASVGCLAGPCFSAGQVPFILDPSYP